MKRCKDLPHKGQVSFLLAHAVTLLSRTNQNYRFKTERKLDCLEKLNKIWQCGVYCQQLVCARAADCVIDSNDLKRVSVTELKQINLKAATFLCCNSAAFSSYFAITNLKDKFRLEKSSRIGINSIHTPIFCICVKRGRVTPSTVALPEQQASIISHNSITLQ